MVAAKRYCLSVIVLSAVSSAILHEPTKWMKMEGKHSGLTSAYNFFKTKGTPKSHGLNVNTKNVLKQRIYAQI